MNIFLVDFCHLTVLTAVAPKQVPAHLNSLVNGHAVIFQPSHRAFVLIYHAIDAEPKLFADIVCCVAAPPYFGGCQLNPLVVVGVVLVGLLVAAPNFQEKLILKADSVAVNQSALRINFSATTTEIH